jgi:two-component sensor histidine kinase
MKAGAQDYLVKDRITAEGLFSAIQRAIEKVALIRELKEERDRMAGSLAEKEVLLKEVHHRVKNNLQVIASLLRLQANALDDPALISALRECQHRVESMALVHEQLYETKDLRDVDLARHVDVLATNLFHGYGDPPRISWKAQVEPIRLAVDRAIPVSLILNELISNAFKHAFPGARSGSILIEGGHGKDGSIFISVRDDGAGMPEQIAADRPKSLGLEIVKILTRQLKGALEIDRTQGTRFRINFPQHAA